MHASRGKAVVVTMTERRSRLHLLARSPDCMADNVIRAIAGRLGRLHTAISPLTANNGKEFADHQTFGIAL